MSSPHALNYSPHLVGQLHVMTAVSNPQRFESRYRLAREAIQRFEAAGAVVWIVELAFGDRGFAVTEPGCARHVRLRTRHELWHKESMLNVGLAHLSRQVPDWKYVAFVDADVQFARPDWALETVHLLQHFDVVQMFSHGQDLLANHAPFSDGSGLYSSYSDCYLRQVRPNWLGAYEQRGGNWHPGYAWAWRREALDTVGGLVDIGILGAGDRHMAAGLIGRMDETLHPRLHPAYRLALHEWQRRAELGIRRNVGVMDGLLLHYWHGPKAGRRYVDRWRILVRNQYNPAADVSRDTQGLLQLVDRQEPRSIRLRDDIRAYFAARNEDSIENC
jgi:glycosyltransferase involved in cell wall biosynthesis